MEPMPVGSKTNLPLAEAEPISDGDSASGTTDLGRGGGVELQHNSSWERGARSQKHWS